MPSLNELIPRLWPANTVDVYGPIFLKILKRSFRHAPKNAIEQLDKVP
tara:strand:- start:552 stop:695 length:144 start_codon:yes stop_codon:yes gene_type:complete